jgi:negative regulator of replication initiation
LATNNKANKSSKVSEVSKALKETKVTKTSKANKVLKNNKVTKPKKIIVQYIFIPKVLYILEHYKNKSNTHFIHGYLEWLSKDENTSIDITMSISEEYKFLQ